MLLTQIRSGFLILDVVHLNVLQNVNLLHEVGVGLEAKLVVLLGHLAWAGVDDLGDVLQLLQLNLL